MTKVFIVSDTHFGHMGVCRFPASNGCGKLRPWDHPDQMDEDMIQRWNSVVNYDDKVYHLGDVVINRKALPILHRLNGDKVLIKGNHDIFKLSDYTPYFRDIRAYHILDNIVFSHIPVHRSSIGRFKGNAHGHLHDNFVQDKFGKPDRAYFNCCVENHNYTPIELGVVIKYFKDQE